MTVTQAAEHLGVGRAAVSALVNERAAVSIEMAHRLAKAFGSSADHWMRMQLAYDLAQAQDLARGLDITRIKR